MGRERRRLFAFFFNAGGNPDHGEGGGFVYGASFPNVATFHVANVVGPPQALTGSRYINTSAFHTAVVQRGLVVEATLFTNVPSFKTAVVSYGNAVAGSLFTDSDAFHNASVTSIATPITGTLFANTNTFQTSVVTKVPINVTGSLFSNAPAFHVASLSHMSTLGQFTLNIDSLAENEPAQPITGSLFVGPAATFETADVRHGANITGSKFTNTPSFKTAVISTSLKVITASLYSNTPDTFFSSNTVVSGWDGNFPNASNTGVPAGTTLTNSGPVVVYQQDGAIVQNLNITGDIQIHSNNVTIRRCRIQGAGDWYSVRLFPGYGGLLMEDCEIDSGGVTVNALAGSGTFRRMNIHSCDNGINIWGTMLIEDCYIHDMDGGVEAHFDCIECNGVSSGDTITIRRCNFVNQETQTAALMFNNEFGSLQNILVENSRLVGGGYTIYVDARKNANNNVDDASIRFINNRIGSGFFGYYAFLEANPITTGNVDDITGNPI